MNTDIKSIVRLIDNFARQHMNVKRFKFDTLDRMPDFTGYAEAYPVLYAVLTNLNKYNTNSYNYLVYTLNIYCGVPRFDIIPKEDNDIELNQTLNNMDIASHILNDLVNYLDEQDENNIFVESGVMIPINNYTNTDVQGLMMTFNIEVSDFSNFCEIPLIADEEYNEGGYSKEYK